MGTSSSRGQTAMNLLCPNCQKMLTVPEEYAGQLMKCPLCDGTFTVPALPTSAPATPVPAGPPPAGPDVYGLRNEPEPHGPPPFRPDGVTAPDVKPPPPSSTATTKTPPPPPPEAPSPSTAPPEGYTRSPTVWLSPKVLRWVPAVALVLVFFLQFFSWVGLYPGGVPGVTQSAWGAAFGVYTQDHDLDPVLPSMQKTEKPEDNSIPGASALTIFYLLLFFPALAVTVAVLVFDLNLIQVKLPPQVDKLLPWRWGIVAAVNLVLLFFLSLQLVFGFSLDSKYGAWVERQVQAKEAKKTDEVKLADVTRGRMLEDLTHTFWFKLVILLHILATVAAVLMYLLLQRGDRRPLPRMELLW
jgi:hypothetical protein